MDLIRPLGLVGIPCASVGPADNPTAYSRFTKASIYWNGDIWKPSDDLVDVLLGFALKQVSRPVLFYQGDMQLLLISRNRDRLRQGFRFVVADQALVEILVDKARFQAFAEQKDLPIPRGQVVDTAVDDKGIDCGIPFPIIMKPIVRHRAWRRFAASQKALQFTTSEELRAVWPRLQASGIKVLIQELIPGPETCIESYHVYATGGGVIEAEFTGRKVRTMPPLYGQSTAVTVTDAGDVAELGRHVVRKLKLEGVAKLDFKRRPDGKLTLLEINPRFNLWHHVGAVAGVNLPALVYADLLDLPRPKCPPARTGTSWCKPMVDRRAAKEAGFPNEARFSWTSHCEAKSANWDDPLPILISRLRGFRAFRHILNGLSYSNRLVK